MINRSRAYLAVNAWFLLVLACLFLMIGGSFILAGWWWKDLSMVGRIVGGGCLVLIGSGVGYFGTLRFFWYIVHWLAKNKPNSGKPQKGPKVVIIGGGTGLGTILRGLKEVTSNLTAIVTVADDGGSSGRLRREFNILPPGDIRNCIIALADLEPLMEQLLQYRFRGASDLSGHNFGNLFLTAMTGITGDFEQAIKATSKVLAVRGQVLPATLEHVVLKARLTDGSVVSGESAITRAGAPIREVFIDPPESRPVEEALTAINEAEVIILGPGSLYTSIIPNLLVKELAEAIRKSSATKIYICNAMTQTGETDGFTASDHIRAIIKHAGKNLIDLAVINTETIPPDIMERYAEEGACPVEADFEKVKELGINPLGMEVIVKSSVIRHDALKLAALIEEIARTKKLERAFGKHFTKQIFKLFKGISGFLFIKIFS